MNIVVNIKLKRIKLITGPLNKRLFGLNDRSVLDSYENDFICSITVVNYIWN